MKVTRQWLQDFVPVTVSSQRLAEMLTMAGLEVKAGEEIGGDSVFEIEITSNRPDWLSVAGIAREIAALTGKKMTVAPAPRAPARGGRAGKSLFTVRVEHRQDCAAYFACVIKGVRVGPSPEWLKKRLERIGCRSINNVVDVTNYLMFSWGQPLHAFDLARLEPSNAIAVRRARAGETLTTIDGAALTLSSEDLVIADGTRPVALAGIMGGKDTEVSDATKDILLEAAVFDPLLIRRSRRRHGLQSESSYRFERSVNRHMTAEVAQRAAALIRETAGGSMEFFGGVAPAAYKAASVAVDLDAVARLLALRVPVTRCASLMQGLGFKVLRRSSRSMTVQVPSFRSDVKDPVDVVEEIARIAGYAHIPTTLPAIKPQPQPGRTSQVITALKETLVGLGMQEAVTYSLIDRASLADVPWLTFAPLAIANPLSSEQEVLRPTLTIGLLRAVAVNVNQQQPRIALFEVARVYEACGGHPREVPTVSFALCGEDRLFGTQGVIRGPLGIAHAKGIVTRLCEKLGLGAAAFEGPDADGRICVAVGDDRIGHVWLASETMRERCGLKDRSVVLAEIALPRVVEHALPQRRFAALPKFPAVTRDISVTVRETCAAETLVRALTREGAPLLRTATVIDYYQGAQVPAGSRALTISCEYRADDRTLTDAQVAPLHERLCQTLVQKFSATLR